MRAKEIKVHGVQTEPKKISLDGQEVTCFDYNASKKILVIPKDPSIEWSVSLLEKFTLSWED